MAPSRGSADEYYDDANDEEGQPRSRTSNNSNSNNSGSNNSGSNNSGSGSGSNINSNSNNNNDLNTPRLRPFLKKLPPPSEMIAGQRTPTASPVHQADDAFGSFEAGDANDAEDNGDGDGDGDDAADDVPMEEEDFEARISRQSPASTASEDDDDDDDDDDDGDYNIAHANGQMLTGGSSAANEEYDARSSASGGASGPPSSPVTLQRIRSLPMPPMRSSSFPLKSAGNGGHNNMHQQQQQQHQPLLHASQSAISLRMPPPPPPPLYPPFYNRPPTPLPPSPSLTSLLRPPSLLNRSTTSTRATTPDSSDVETPMDTEAAVAQSARRAHPLPPTSPKVPTYEYYGFVLYLASSLAFLMYILWSYLPSPFLHALGITYYPNRWWSLAIPAWIVMLLVYTYVALLAYNVEYLTLPLTSTECMVDEAGNVAILDASGRIRKGGSTKFLEELARQQRNADAHTSHQSSSSGGGGTKAKRRHDDERQHHGSTHKSTGSWGKNGRRRRRDKERERERDEDHHHQQQQQSFGFNGPSLNELNLSWRQIWNEGTDAVMDVPIGGVCEVLYGDG